MNIVVAHFDPSLVSVGPVEWGFVAPTSAIIFFFVGPKIWKQFRSKEADTHGAQRPTTKTQCTNRWRRARRTGSVTSAEAAALPHGIQCPDFEDEVRHPHGE